MGKREMKSLVQIINEKLKIKKRIYKYQPKTKQELQNIIKRRIIKEGSDIDLNDIDVSEITDMSGLFEDVSFNGDISGWDVSNVTDMSGMFMNSSFNNDSICDWNVSKVKNMYAMFNVTKFNQDLSNWNIENVEDMGYMFSSCTEFEGIGLDKWNPIKLKKVYGMFSNCNALKCDLSNWDLSNVKEIDYLNMFLFTKSTKYKKPKYFND